MKLQLGENRAYFYYLGKFLKCRCGKVEFISYLDKTLNCRCAKIGPILFFFQIAGGPKTGLFLLPGAILKLQVCQNRANFGNGKKIICRYAKIVLIFAAPGNF